MAMYGWLVSSQNYDAQIDPATLNQLKSFSQDSGKGPFKFVIGDVVNTPNGEGSMDHTIWIEIYDKESNDKRGEISTELSDNEDPLPSSMDVTLALCLQKLGFLDETDVPAEMPDDAFEGMDMEIPDADLPLPDDEAKVAARRMKAAARLLEAIRDTGIHVDSRLLPRTARVSDSVKALDHFIRGTR